MTPVYPRWNDNDWIGMLHREHIRGNESMGTGPAPSPSAPGQHDACREGSMSPPVSPHRGGWRPGAERTFPPEVVTAERRRRSGGPNRPARTKSDAEFDEKDRGIRAGPTGPEKRSGEARAASRVEPAAAPRACGAELRRPPPRWSWGGRPGIRAGPTGPTWGGTGREPGRPPAPPPRACGAE